MRDLDYMLSVRYECVYNNEVVGSATRVPMVLAHSLVLT